MFNKQWLWEKLKGCNEVSALVVTKNGDSPTGSKVAILYIIYSVYIILCIHISDLRDSFFNFRDEIEIFNSLSCGSRSRFSRSRFFIIESHVSRRDRDFSSLNLVVRDEIENFHHWILKFETRSRCFSFQAGRWRRSPLVFPLVQGSSFWQVLHLAFSLGSLSKKLPHKTPIFGWCLHRENQSLTDANLIDIPLLSLFSPITQNIMQKSDESESSLMFDDKKWNIVRTWKVGVLPNLKWHKELEWVNTIDPVYMYILYVYNLKLAGRYIAEFSFLEARSRFFLFLSRFLRRDRDFCFPHLVFRDEIEIFAFLISFFKTRSRYFLSLSRFSRRFETKSRAKSHEIFRDRDISLGSASQFRIKNRFWQRHVYSAPFTC